MFTISNKCFIFLTATAGILLCGFAIKLDNYEYNSLTNLNNSYSQVNLSYSSYSKMPLKKGEWFRYYTDGNEYQQKIVSIEDKESYYELILSGALNEKPINTISYKMGKMNLWKEILK